MAIIDHVELFGAVFLLVIGLIFEASGFGIFVSGRLDGVVIIVIGVTMFWGGWVMSRAKGLSNAVAAFLNMIDAASTVAFWNFEVNPFVLAVGPTIFLIAKITCSVAIVLYAKLAVNPGKSGAALAGFFALIVVWNLSQHLLAYFGFKGVAFGILVGSVLSFIASAVLLYLLVRSERTTPNT